MTAPFDQDENAVEAAFPGAEIVSPAPGKLPAALGDYKPASVAEAEFLSLLTTMPWTVADDAAIEMALRTATGDPEEAGSPPEARSVRNLKLANKRHSIDAFALALSSRFSDSTGRACPVYAQLEAHFPDGEVFTYSIGGWGPIGQLVAWQSGAKLPREVQIVEIPSDKGNPAYRYQDA